MPNCRQVGYRHVSAISMLAAVPYLLLSASQDVKLTTVVNWDGSGLREYTVSYSADRQAEVKRRLRERTGQFDRETSPHCMGAVCVIKRSWRPAKLESIEGTSLRMTGIVQEPLNVFTHYRWSEDLEVYRETATPVETFGEGMAVLRYELKMPGRVTQAGGAREIRGNTVTWELSGGTDKYTLEATSRRVRWGYLAFLVYVVGFVVFQIVHYSAQVIRNRPRKI